MNKETEAALREFVQKEYPLYGSSMDEHRREMQNDLLNRLTALISQHFVPKEDHDLILAENRQLKKKFDEVSEDYVNLMNECDNDILDEEDHEVHDDINEDRRNGTI